MLLPDICQKLLQGVVSAVLNELGPSSSGGWKIMESAENRCWAPQRACDGAEPKGRIGGVS